jgi:protein SCO1/2
MTCAGQRSRKGRLCAAQLLVVAALVVLLGLAEPARAQPPPPAAAAAAGFDQRLNNALPLQLVFQNDHGAPLRLADLFTGKPVILTFNYFRCTNLCPLMLEELARSLRDIDFGIGQDFQVISVSIDPTDTTMAASQKKADLLGLYARPGADDGWHFLLAAPTVLQVLAQAAGLRYAYDTRSREYIHPLGVLVLTPDGRIARYLYGLDISARDLRLALVEASQGTIGTAADQLALLCFHYDPASGSYSALAFEAARWVGIATVAGLGLFLASLWRKEFDAHKANHSS